MNDPIRKLPADALLALAETLDGLALESRSLGETKAAQRDRRGMAARKAAFLDAAQMVETYASHMSLEQAVAVVARQTGLSLETVAIHARLRRQAQESRSRFARDRRIVALARKGWSNGEIGAVLGLHPGTVSRIIRRALAGVCGH